VSQFDRSAGTVIPRYRILEEVQHMLCAIGRPYGQKAMTGITQSATATHGNKPRVSDLGEDHLLQNPFSFE
jgi:hypothetical protein